jgi:general secretion pathway protein J
MDNSPTLHASCRREGGFTLIELLVSLTILTIILGLLSAALKTLSQNWASNAARIERIEMVSRAFDIFTRDISGLQRLVTKIKEAQQFVFTGNQSHLSFVTIEPPYPTSPGPYFIDYSVARNGPSFNLIRARAPYQTNMHTFPGATPANSVELMQGRFKYHFSYAQKSAKGEKWLSFWRKRDRLPDLIRLEVIDIDHGVEITPPFIASLRTDAELGCLSESSDTCTAKTDGKLVRDETQASVTPGIPQNSPR